MHKPDYTGGGIVNLMASLQSGLGGERSAYAESRTLGVAEIEDAKCVVLIIVDGLGFEFLKSQAAAKFLNASLRGALTSVFPSTTASAITTFLTGAAPQQHGVVGWHMYMREMGAVITVLPGLARYGGPLLAESGIDFPALLGNRGFAEKLGVASHMVMPKAICNSAYTLAHKGPAQVSGYDTLEDMFEQTLACVKGAAGRCYVHAYWPQLDFIGHRFGMGSAAADAAIGAFDQAFGAFIERLEGTGTLVVLTADHGQIDTSPDDWITMSGDTPAGRHLAVPLCGEPRAAFCYPHASARELFADAVSEIFGAHVLHESSTWVEDHWFGLGEPNPELRHRIGDYVLVPDGSRAVKDWLALERPYSLIGIHGGATAEEMYVPLVTVAP
ncbi:MAG: phosphodiesterase [Gammaproteobacteria bacterium]|nr:phosphodiesterase [Gammaproteobacteria bacterium]